MLKPKLLLALSLLLFHIVQSQNGRQYSFIHYTIESGLASNQVNSVVQDDKGYIWLATTEGLQRFDGTRYKTFRAEKNNPRSLPTSTIQQLIIDKNNNLWLVTSEYEVGIFNTRDFSFRKVSIRPSDPNSPPTTNRLHTDNDGNIFLHLQGLEVLSYNAEKNEFSQEKNFLKLPREMHVIDFAQQPGTRKYWVGLYPEGLAIFNATTGTLSYAGNNVEKEPAIDRLDTTGGIIRCVFDKNGKFWYVTWGGGFPFANCYDPANDRPILKQEFIKDLKTYNELYGFFQQQDGTIWTHGLGVFARYQEKENHFQLVYNGYLNDRSLYFDAIQELYEDRKNNIWIATRNHGLYRFNPAREYFSNTSHINRVNNQSGKGGMLSFIQTKWGTTLAGSWGDGVYHYDKEMNLIPTNIKGFDNKMGPIIWDMYASADSNTIWMSSQPGFFALDQDKKQSTYYNPAIMESKTIRQIVEDRNGNLWFGLQRLGVFKWNKSKGSLKQESAYESIEAVPVTQVNKLMMDAKGMIWAGTAAMGLYVVDPATNRLIMRFSKKEPGSHSLPEDGISSVLDYNDSLVVITTSKSILLYNRKHDNITALESPEPLSGYITSVERDRNGYLWLSTTSGLYRINPFRKVFVKFSKRDGIDNENFILAASARMPDGRLMFGSSNHFISFEPSRIQLSNASTDVAITDFKVMNKSLQVDSLFGLKKVELDYDNNSLEIEFSSLSFNGDFPILYKMEGLDKNWKMADQDKHAIYSYVPPGNYQFLVRAIDAEGNETGNITSLAIEVNPPFWNSWWFYSSLALLVIGLLYYMDKERMGRKEAIQKMRSDIAQNLHRDVTIALNNINILSEMARIKADKDTQKSKEYIEQIHTRSHNMIIAMDDMLWSIDPANDNMAKTIERMKEYIAALNSRNGANIEMVVDRKVEKLELNMKLRHESFILFKEGIRKLVDSGAVDCKVHIGLEKSNMQFTIQFDNCACNMQQLNNLLQSQEMEKRVRSIFADMKVQVHKSNSLIFLKVPLN